MESLHISTLLTLTLGIKNKTQGEKSSSVQRKNKKNVDERNAHRFPGSPN